MHSSKRPVGSRARPVSAAEGVDAMGHVPHVLLPGPWDGPLVSLSPDTRRHLEMVLRLRDGSPCSYTDGAGSSGNGVIEGDAIRRGRERLDPPMPDVTLAVAPPAAKDRLRWLVEKSCELGVTRIRWIRTRYGEGRIPRPDRAASWAQMAMEQSRRTYITEIDDGWCTFSDLPAPRVVLDAAGDTLARIDPPCTVVVGPEGGWASGEVPADAVRVTLGDGVLRTETAAILGVFVSQRAAH